MELYYITDKESFLVNSLNELKLYIPVEESGDSLIYKSFLQRVYYYISDEKVFFSFSIVNFETISDFEYIIDDDFAFFYKNVGFIVPPYTIYKDVYLLPSYCILKVENEKFIFEPYYPVSTNNRLDLFEFEDRLVNGVKKALNYKTIILHGGGADSSLLIALASKNKVKAECLTCVMTGMENEADLAVSISNNKGYNNNIHNCNPVRLNEISLEYMEKNYQLLCDPAMPILTEMLEDKECQAILDGQGADSLLLSLPHVKLLKLYKRFNSWFFKPLNCILSLFNFSKTSSLGRKLYRMKKVIYSLSQNSIEDCLLTSLNFPVIKNSKYYQYVSGLFNNLISVYDDKYKSLSYFFLFYVLPVREMQKYDNLLKMNIRPLLPFLEHDFIDYIFTTKTKDLFDGKNVKKPVFDLLEKELPGYLKKNITHPFYVNYSKALMDYNNEYKGRQYPILDKNNFQFTSHNLYLLANLLRKK